MSKILKCLIVDDDEKFRQILKMRLKSINYQFEVEEKGTITDAKQYLAANTPDLIFLDQHLPDGMGYEMLNSSIPESATVIALSSDKSPDLPVLNLKGGAKLFFEKSEVSRAFFFPLVEALMGREELERKRQEEKEINNKIETVKTLVRTLQHEINNPLGAVFGGVYLLRSDKTSEEDKKEAIRVLEESSTRIKSVLDKLGAALTLDEVNKGPDKLFHIPGDKEWIKK